MTNNTPPNASPKSQSIRTEEKPEVKLEYNLTQEQKDWLEHEAHELRRRIQNEYLEGYNNEFDFFK